MNIETKEFDISAAHRLVRTQKAMGNDVVWDGWDIVFYRPSPFARTNPDGAFHNGTWSFANRVTVDADGLWRIDRRNIKHSRRTRA